MSQTLFTATIKHSSEDRRIRIECRRDGDRFRWYGPSNDGTKSRDTEVSSPTSDGLHGAMNAAEAAWGSPTLAAALELAWERRRSRHGQPGVPRIRTRISRGYESQRQARPRACRGHGRPRLGGGPAHFAPPRRRRHAFPRGGDRRNLACASGGVRACGTQAGHDCRRLHRRRGWADVSQRLRARAHNAWQ